VAEADPGAAGARRRIGGCVVGVLTLVWVFLTVALLAVVGLEALYASDLECAVPAADSVYGEAAWQWWPPGQVCLYGDIRFREPGDWRAWAIVVDVILGGVLLVAWRRSRHAPDPDWSA
jgi:hypothetical protein